MKCYSSCLYYFTGWKHKFGDDIHGQVVSVSGGNKLNTATKKYIGQNEVNNWSDAQIYEGKIDDG